MISRTSIVILTVIAAICALAQSVPFELESQRRPKINTHGNCIIKNARILTVTKGIIENGDILIKNGKIAAIGRGLSAPADFTVIDATGRVVTPGIVDAHSHRASDATNEGTDSITADVRIVDVLNPSNKNVWQALASGQTAGLVLHGSANAIGGQSVVVKWKYQRPVQEMIVKDAPRMIKFALGENVTRSGSQTPNRFPRTRMGVEAVYRRAFAEAKEYMKAWDEYKRNGSKGDPPRRDLRLEALAGVLKREIWVQCHSYRADEILMLVRLSKEYGFKIGAMQHALEAYKIAPELAAAGVPVSIFADSWSYKIEAYDAIPYNAYICNKAGVLVSINTDSLGGTVAHAMDAAKVMRYGGLTEEDALKMLTINPAKQLGIDHRTGSLEVGKDADIAIWSGHPLSPYSRCEMTIIEGEVFFQRRDAFGVDAISYTQNTLPTTKHTSPVTLPRADRYAIVGAVIHPVSGPTIQNGTLLVQNGRIAAVGSSVNIPPGTPKINANGKQIYPGFIDGGSMFGLSEVGQVPQTQDASELGDFQPDLVALTAINIESEHIPVARCMGITSAVVKPTGGIICGQGSLINLGGWTNQLLAELSPCSLIVNYPGSGGGFGGNDASDDDEFTSGAPLPTAEPAAAALQDSLTEYFEKAKKYAEDKAAGKNVHTDPRLEAMIPYVTGKKSVIIRVRTAASIRNAIKLAKTFGLKAILAGAQDAWKETKLIAESKYPLIITVPGKSTTGANSPVSDTDPYDCMYAQPAVLAKAGIKFCFQSDDSAEAMNLPLKAAECCAYGMKPDQVLKALTLDAAQILGVENDLGSIQKGKLANFIITDGDPFQLTTNIEAVVIKGESVPCTSKFTRLRDKYLARLAQK